mgnify:CR=1 FL=1
MPIREVPVTEITKMMREELKSVFPKIDFSVRKTGYDSIYVTWTDGPTQAEVQAIDDKLVATSQALVALITDLKANGALT